MGIVGILLAALIVGFLVMTNMSAPPSEEARVDSLSGSKASRQIEGNTPRNTIDAVQQQADSLLKKSEDKYRELDK